MTDFPMARLLLLSNSTNHGKGYLDHCMEEILDILDGRQRLAFVPFALLDRETYGAKAQERFRQVGIETRSLSLGNTAETLDWAEAFFVGGGNTFRLLKTLQEGDLLTEVRQRVSQGAVYMGASAGANIAAPTIRTTNDMPIVEPGSFDAIALVPFQINPHYVDPPPNTTHMGETRDQRLAEYLEENAAPVVGIPEGAWIRVDDRQALVGGTRPIRIFRRHETPEERHPGEDLSDLLEPSVST
ncbi:MAG: dipeptidase PepE [Acidobacteriota bacterium]|nr:dipeptidase PepE [Acidobacteriota bacterium]